MCFGHAESQIQSHVVYLIMVYNIYRVHIMSNTVLNMLHTSLLNLHT